MLTTPDERHAVLLVDDNASVRELVARLLRSRGYDVIEATSGEEAEVLYGGREKPITLLVCDVMMLGLSGPELAKRLTARQPSLRTLLISGDPTNAPREGESATAFLSKPFSSKQLLDRVRTLLS